MVMKATPRSKPPRLWPGFILFLSLLLMGAAFWKNTHQDEGQFAANLLAKATKQQNQNRSP